MHPNEQLIERFYTAFQGHDAEEMVRCYHPDIVFTDPVFGRLEGPCAADMWRMLCARAQDLEVHFSDIHADATHGAAHWEAVYTYGEKCRCVHNVVDASFTFKDGLIIQHTDTFDLWRWTRMALGPLGLFLGWTPFLKKAIRNKVSRRLESFRNK